MVQPEITRKLSDLFERHRPLDEECHVVYLMVETRNYLDRMDDNGAGFRLLRFYCDWALHTEKTKSLSHISPIIDTMYQNAAKEIQGPYGQVTGSALEFMYFSHLRNELDAFLRSAGISQQLTGDNQQWAIYCGLMASILADQPILNPTKDVSRCMFEPAETNCVIGRLEFARPIKGQDDKLHGYYSFANAY